MEYTNQQPDRKPETDLISGYVDEMKLAEMERHKIAVKKARNALFIVAGLVFIREIIGMYSGVDGGFDITIFLIALLEAGVFVALGFWTHKRPYAAIAGGLAAFIGILLLSAVLNGYLDGPGAAFRALSGGVIIKIFVMVTLIRALRDARELEHFKKDTF